MPAGPQGQKRPNDPVAAAVMVGRIATGQVEEARRTSVEPNEDGRFDGLTAAEAQEIGLDKWDLMRPPFYGVSVPSGWRNAPTPEYDQPDRERVPDQPR